MPKRALDTKEIEKTAEILPNVVRRRGRPRRSERAVELRVAAIEVASELLMAKGTGLSMESVAKKLGVRAPSLYHHFPGGRDEMILAVAEHYCRIFGEALDGIVAGSGSAVEKLRAVAGFFAGSGSVHPYNVLTEERNLISQAARNSLRVMFERKVEAPLLDLLRQGQEAGELRTMDPELAMRSLLALYLRLAQMSVSEGQAAALPDFITDMLMHGLSIEKGRGLVNTPPDRLRPGQARARSD